MSETLMEKIVRLAKNRGFIFPGSEIYGGLGGTWDYGPFGVELKNNLKRAWWRSVVWERDGVVGVDAAILMHPRVWEASGHTQAFTDPLVECKLCHQRFRADHEDEVRTHREEHPDADPEALWTEPRKFNLLVEASLGVVENQKSTVYLRGEITQGVHVNFKNVLDAGRLKIPFGIAQIGKAFRNEITPGNFTFRSREFEQMELQFYVKPEDAEGARWFAYWKEQRLNWYLSLGFRRERLRFRDHAPGERAHYARAATDIEYDAPFGGWREFEGIHHRGDWDLRRHAEYSGKDLSYFDEETRERFTPWVIETSGGVDRAVLFLLIDAYREEEVRGERRVVLKFHPRLAPVKAAVLPLLRNNENLVAKAREIYQALKAVGNVEYDASGSIGRRYRRQDEVGTPYVVTVDHETLEDDTVTVRDRDTMAQERVSVAELPAGILARLAS